MRITATSEAEAKALADKAHAHKIATDPAYAKSVEQGRTTNWAVPRRDLDDKGQPVGDWFIAVEGSVLESFSEAEQVKLDVEAKAILAERTKSKEM